MSSSTVINDITNSIKNLRQGDLVISGNKTFSGTTTFTGAVNLSGPLDLSPPLTANGILSLDSTGLMTSTHLNDGQLLIGSTAGAAAAATVAGTANQVIVTNGSGTITLSAPQNIGLTSTPTFASETLTAATNQLVLGTTLTTTLTAPAPVANRVVTIPDGGADSSVVLTESAQTINGNKTYGGNAIFANTGAGVTYTGTIAQTGASPLVINGRVGVAAFTGIADIAADGTAVLTISNSAVNANALLALEVVTAVTASVPVIQSVVYTVGASMDVTIRNRGAVGTGAAGALTIKFVLLD